MLATLVVGTSIVGSTASLSGSASVYHFFADGPHEALMLAQEIHEAGKLLPWEAEAGDPALYGSDVTTLFDLDEQSYKPPRSAGYDIITSHLSWKQEVAVNHVSLEDPTLVVDPETFEGDTLVQLEVTVSKGSTEVDTFTWWMTEPVRR